VKARAVAVPEEEGGSGGYTERSAPQQRLASMARPLAPLARPEAEGGDRLRQHGRRLIFRFDGGSPMTTAATGPELYAFWKPRLPTRCARR
jgi:hypothetical protein